MDELFPKIVREQDGMVPNIDISVIIPVYNGERYIADAIHSVLNQTMKVREVIVVNDGSTDSTPSILANFGDIIRVVCQPNRGVSAARNAGIRLASANWIGQLDVDDTWRANKVERIAGAILNRPSSGLVYSAVRYFWENSNQVQERHQSRNIECEGILHELVSHNVIIGGCSGPVIRRKCFENVGLFDESLRAAEDWDMWIRIASNYEISYIDDVLVDRRERLNSLSRNIDRMLASDLQVFEKHKDNFRCLGIPIWKLRRARAAVFARSGVAYFCSGQISKARHALSNALKLNPFSIKAIVPMLKILTGIQHRSKTPQ